MGEHTKRRKIFNFLKTKTSSKSIIFLQETHTLKKYENLWTGQFGCGSKHIFFSHGVSDSRGVLIAFREIKLSLIVTMIQEIQVQ
jgi:hypothetical protein